MPSQQYNAGGTANYGSVGQTSQSGISAYGPPGAPETAPHQGPEPEGVAEHVVPTAPPIRNMQRIPGYDQVLEPNVTFVPPPTSYQEATSGTSIEQISSTAKLTKAEARDLLIAVAKSKCCWGKDAAESMTFKSLQQSTAVHYVLKTFLETRSTDWASEPFHGQMVDGPQNGPAPSPWDIPISTPEMFCSRTLKTEVPHTAFVGVCHGCSGSSRVFCPHCSGTGCSHCPYCNHGFDTTATNINGKLRICSGCQGRYRVRCMDCDGRGRMPCPTCQASGQMKCFVQMTTIFKTHVKDFILERTPLPDHLIRYVTGTTLLEDTQPLLNPIQSFPEPQVNEKSASLIQEHRALAQTGRIWMQNHVIRGVPVFQCDCQWNDQEFQFFVLGNNRRVHTDDYPQTCCCGCSLL